MYSCIRTPRSHHGIRWALPCDRGSLMSCTHTWRMPTIVLPQSTHCTATSLIVRRFKIIACTLQVSQEVAESVVLGKIGEGTGAGPAATAAAAAVDPRRGSTSAVLQVPLCSQ